MWRETVCVVVVWVIRRWLMQRGSLCLRRCGYDPTRAPLWLVTVTSYALWLVGGDIMYGVDSNLYVSVSRKLHQRAPSENWYYRILLLMTGQLENATVVVDALSVCMTINELELIPFAFFAGTGPIMMSAGELESENAGEPAKLIRQRYREAADIIKKGKMCCLFINDLDAGAGRLGGTTQYTVNNQMVNATLMNIADNPTNVQLPGMYNKEENPRVPIVVTGNDFSTLYAPLIRDGRMEKFYWAPTREDRIGVCQGIFRSDGVPKDGIVKIVDTFPGQSIDFFGALRARVYDDEVRKWISGVGVEHIGKRLVNSKDGPPTFEQPKMTIEKLLEYGNMLVQEQENVKRVQLADKYLGEAALGDANEDAIKTGNFYGQGAQQVAFPVQEGYADPYAENYDPTVRSDDGSCSYNL
ncbi:unnamed protein product [Vicia faba]|uniref:Ribulose bisphosphate carboxylase/oxygenase activase, chloroplastic n=1 Tax=Vicia faba TaxID=3906 RepID=A0AAV1AQU7_VICFA|nr:unnamed protein product [Vicia faba]